MPNTDSYQDQLSAWKACQLELSKAQAELLAAVLRLDQGAIDMHRQKVSALIAKCDEQLSGLQAALSRSGGAATQRSQEAGSRSGQGATSVREQLERDQKGKSPEARRDTAD